MLIIDGLSVPHIKGKTVFGVVVLFVFIFFGVAFGEKMALRTAISAQQATLQKLRGEKTVVLEQISTLKFMLAAKKQKQFAKIRHGGLYPVIATNTARHFYCMTSGRSAKTGESHMYCYGFSPTEH